MMRKITLILLSFYFSFYSHGQKTFNLTVDHEFKNDLLLLKFYVQKNSGEDFTLGTSNIALNLNTDNLDLGKKFKIDSLSSPFDATSDPESYYPLSLGGDKIVNLTIVVNSTGKGTGRKVSSKKMLIAGVAIPVKNKCGKANISWIKDKVALCIYSKNAKPTSIKDKANFVDPVDFALIKPLDIPFISEGADRKLIVNYDGKIQWYFNNDPIVGASSKNIIPLKAGTYFVKVFNECGQSARSRDYLFILTDKKLQSEQTLSIDAFPNPFIDNFHIKLYTPNSEKVRVRVFNCIGNLVYQQEYQLNSIGEYDLNISMNDPHLSSGYYFAEVQVANTTKTIRLIKLNT